jgi:50S ribosomal protein L16 3-hydroxylase
MHIDQPLTLLGGLTPAQFMKRHWQRKPLLVRGAVPGMRALVPAARLFELAARDDVQARLVVQDRGGWTLRQGPLARRTIPPAKQAGWTLLVQGMDLHDAGVHALLQEFRFVPEARLDDLMISHASDGGGVGPHFDSYDVFLLQAHGRRRWRIGRPKDLSLQPDMPLKILARFEPEQEFVLEPGDMLYLPPRYAHDGIAEGECQTYSVGFRAPRRGQLARDLLRQLAEDAEDTVSDTLYQDPSQPATATPGAIPETLQAYAREAVAAALRQGHDLDRALGESLTEPKATVWFERQPVPRLLRGVVLDARTRMLYDKRHIFVNGESWRAAGRDATLMRRLADQRRLQSADLAGASDAARDLLRQWCESGWLHALKNANMQAG